MKMLGTIAAILALIVAAGAYWLVGNLDRLVGSAITSYGSAMTQAKVSVGSVKIAATDGRGVIERLTIANPAGFKTPHAIKIARLELEIDAATVASDVIHIRRIAIVQPDVIYEKGESMTNFDALQKNIETYLGAEEPKPGAKPGKKLIVDEFTIRNAQAQASTAILDGKTVSAPLPDITLKNVGKAEGGITPGELGKRVAAALKAKLTGAFSFDKLMKSTGEALDKTGKAIKKLFK